MTDFNRKSIPNNQPIAVATMESDHGYYGLQGLPSRFLKVIKNIPASNNFTRVVNINDLPHYSKLRSVLWGNLTSNINNADITIEVRDILGNPKALIPFNSLQANTGLEFQGDLIVHNADVIRIKSEFSIDVLYATFEPINVISITEG